MKLTYDKNVTTDRLYNVLRGLRLSNGFYKASHSQQYNYTWLRDNFYASLPELEKNPRMYMQTYHTWLDYYNNVEQQYGKFTHVIEKGRIDNDWEFPNVRINLDLTEVHNEQWGHTQFDTMGYFLYGVAQGQKKGIPIIRNERDKNTVNLVIKLLESIDYYKLEDCGIWEENKENRSSSCGAVISGLVAAKKLGFKVDELKLMKAITHFHSNLLPKETKTRDVDMALLTLIYPFDVLSTQQSKPIINKIENELVREKGTIRYHGDRYYNFGGEAQWTMGNLFLGIIYANQGNIEKAKYYYNSVMKHCPDGNVPELYHANGEKGNNTPLAWSVSLAIMLNKKIMEHKYNKDGDCYKQVSVCI